MQTYKLATLIYCLLILISCTQKPVISTSNWYIEETLDVKKKHPNEPVFILNDSITIKLHTTPEQNWLEYDESVMYYINKSNSEDLKYLTVFGNDYTEKINDIQYIISYPNGRIQYLKMKDFKKVFSYDENIYASNSYYYYHTLSNYQEGTKIFKYVSRSIKKPEFYNSEIINNRFITNSMTLVIDLPSKNQIKFGIENDRDNKIAHTKHTSLDRTIHHFQSSNIQKLNLSRPSKFPENWYPSVYFSFPPFGGTSLTWAQLGDYYLNMANKYIQQTTMASNPLQALDGTDSAKADVIYSWIQQNVRYHADARGLHSIIPRSPEKVLKNGYGDCKEMSTLFKNMLKQNGVGSNLVLIKSDEGKQLHPDYPSLNNFNHMILNIPSISYPFVDPTNRKTTVDNSYFGLAYQKVFILQDGASYIDSIIPSEKYPTKVRTKSKIYRKSKNWYMDGEIKIQGQGAFYLTQSHSYTSEKAIQKKLKSYLKSIFEINAITASIDIKSWDEVHLTYSQKINENVIKLGDTGIRLNSPSLYGGATSYTTIDHEGIRFIGDADQQDVWEFPFRRLSVDKKSTSNEYFTLNWKKKRKTVSRTFTQNRQVIPNSKSDDFRKAVSKRINSLKQIVWK